MPFILRAFCVLVIMLFGIQPGFAQDCRMFEVEVAGIDSSGEYHPLFNFGQALKVGEPWEFRFENEGAGLLYAHITWQDVLGKKEPSIKLSLVDDPTKTTKGSVILERLVWDSLFGPDPFTTSQKTPLLLPKHGRPFATAAVYPTSCGTADAPN